MRLATRSRLGRSLSDVGLFAPQRVETQDTYTKSSSLADQPVLCMALSLAQTYAKR
jgi:hypothetical protein